MSDRLGCFGRGGGGKDRTYPVFFWVRRGRDLMVVGFTTTNAISVYHH